MKKKTIRLADFIRLCRPHQWYKNILIFFPLFFSQNLFNFNYYPPLLLGFLCLILTSSSFYIFNDIFDRNNDKYNKEKKKTNDIISKSNRYILTSSSLLLFFCSLVISYSIDNYFFYLNLLLFFSSFFYSLFFKHIIFLDIIMISINYIIRTYSGTSIMDIYASPLIITSTFTLAFLLISGKRYAEFQFLKNNRKNFRTVFRYYTKKSLKIIFFISITLFLLNYIYFSFFSEFSQKLIYLFPLFTLIIYKYAFLINKSSPIGRNPEKIFQNKTLATLILLFILIATILIYI